MPEARCQDLLDEGCEVEPAQAVMGKQGTLIDALRSEVRMSDAEFASDAEAFGRGMGAWVVMMAIAIEISPFLDHLEQSEIKEHELFKLAVKTLEGIYGKIN